MGRGKMWWLLLVVVFVLAMMCNTVEAQEPQLIGVVNGALDYQSRVLVSVIGPKGIWYKQATVYKPNRYILNIPLEPNTHYLIVVSNGRYIACQFLETKSVEESILGYLVELDLIMPKQPLFRKYVI